MIDASGRFYGSQYGCANTENTDLRGIQYRREGFDAKGAKVGNRKGAAIEFIRRDTAFDVELKLLCPIVAQRREHHRPVLPIR